MEDQLNAIIGLLMQIRDQNTELKSRVDALERDTLLAPRDAAALLGCTTHTLRNREKRGYIRQSIIGGRKGYLLSDLQKIK